LEARLGVNEVCIGQQQCLERLRGGEEDAARGTQGGRLAAEGGGVRYACNKLRAGSGPALRRDAAVCHCGCCKSIAYAASEARLETAWGSVPRRLGYCDVGSGRSGRSHLRQAIQTQAQLRGRIVFGIYATAAAPPAKGFREVAEAL
jgi:hypothetical protein